MEGAEILGVHFAGAEDGAHVEPVTQGALLVPSAGIVQPVPVGAAGHRGERLFAKRRLRVPDIREIIQSGVNRVLQFAVGQFL